MHTFVFTCFFLKLRALNASLSGNVLYLEEFTFKLAKHKMATKMDKPHIFYSLSHKNVQFMSYSGQ